MKNIFKKSENKPSAKIQTLDKKQLSKLIGGLDKGGKSDGLSAETSIDQKGVPALDGNPSL